MRHVPTWILTALAIIIITLLAVAGYLYLRQPSPKTSPAQQASTSFETCLAAGNPITQTSPRQCRDAVSGVTYIEKTNQQPAPTTPQPATRTFQSVGGVKIDLNNWVDSMRVASPFTLTGTVPGNWSFEGSFPVTLTDSTGKVIAQAVAKLTGDWMTTNLVPFTATLTYPGTPHGAGSLTLQKDNPSGLAANSDSLTVPIHY